MRRTTAAIGLGLVVLSAACADKPRKIAIRPPAPETVYVTRPVPAPRATLPVSPTRLAFDALGDTARLDVPAGAQCAAATEGIASIDSTGLVTSVANGDTHLRCWQDGQTATIKVHVQQMVSHVQIQADRALEMGHAGDSIHLALAQSDKRFTPVAAQAPVWLSLAPGVVTVNTAGTALAVADSGRAFIVGQVEGLADTVIVDVGAKGSASKLLNRATNASSRGRTLATAARNAQRTAAPGEVAGQAFSAAGGAPVQTQVQGQAIINARAPRMADSLFQDPSALASLQRLIVPIAMAAIAERRSIPDATTGLVSHSGAMFGGGLDIMTRGPLSFRLRFGTGKLTGDSSATIDKNMTISDGSFEACLAIAPWLTVVGGATSRLYQSSTTEKWFTVGAGGEAAFNLGGGPLYGFASLLVMPLISVSNDLGTSTAPTFGLAAGLGVGLEGQRISARLMYDIEHYSFPSTSARKEQFAQLAFRLGYKFGW